MRWFKALFLLLLLITSVWALNRPWSKIPALGALLNPQTGWMASSTEDALILENQKLPHLSDSATVWVDERWIPHIRATNTKDLYYLQGYIHAYHRLWQMDMQTRAAAGRVSEVAGSKAINFDRGQRRKGMVYGAEQSLKMMEADDTTKAALDAYTLGVNDYIQQLIPAQYPIEYKLMSFAPEPWSNLKTALLLKYMADDLSGQVDDFALSWLKGNLPDSIFQQLYPERIANESPVIPAGTAFAKPSLPIPLPPSDSVFVKMNADSLLQQLYEDPATKGSNNWAVKGKRTKTGEPILGNDPHLGLNLPSLWFEVQLQCGDMNVYGVSLPGAPGVIIGFNDSLAWGPTNNARDVKDFYQIKEAGANAYYFDGNAKPYSIRIESIKVKDSTTLIDTVRYTLHGPVLYDPTFPDPAHTGGVYAVRWMAHEPSNEIRTILGMNEAKNMQQAIEAMRHFICPAQNFAYADRLGNIALFTQGKFINKWKGQGRYVMDGSTSKTLWGDAIPMNENPMIINPPTEYVSSANQVTTDASYPYWYNGGFVHFRAWEVNKRLENMSATTLEEHKEMQQSYHSILAEKMYTFLYQHNEGNGIAPALTSADYELNANSPSAALFQLWWLKLMHNIWADELKNVPNALWPSPEKTMEILLSQKDFSFYDNINTPQRENLKALVQLSYRQAQDSLKHFGDSASWWQVKNVSINHLAKIPAFSVTGLKVGGWGNTINAIKQTHGPSWRMVVQMGKDSISAYGIYPGGQSGNPSSAHYSNNIAPWSEGKYFKLLFLPNSAKQTSKSIIHTFTLLPSVVK